MEKAKTELTELTLNEQYLLHYLLTLEALQETFDSYDPATFNKYAYYLREIVTDKKIRDEIDTNVALEITRLSENPEISPDQKSFLVGFPIIEGVVKFLNYSFRINHDSTSPAIKNLYLKHFFETMRRMQKTFKPGNLQAYSLYILYLKSFIPDASHRNSIAEIINKGKTLVSSNPYLDPDLQEYLVNYEVIGSCMNYLNGALQIVKRDVIINADQTDTYLPKPGTSVLSPLSHRQMVPANLVEAPFDLVSNICNRMTGKIVLDSIVAIYGDRGSGKSEISGYLAEHIAKQLSESIGGIPEDYFTIDNVRSVDKKGTLQMFSSRQLIDKPHQILIADDVSIAANARNYFSEENKRLNEIITVSRIYRHCVILNTVSTNLVDNVLRQFADIGVQAIGPDSETEINEIKVVVFSNPEITSKKKDPFHKFLQFKGSDGVMNRIVRMRVHRASEAFREQYFKLRRENTDRFVIEEFGNGKSDNGQELKTMIKGSVRLQEAYKIHGPKIKEMLESDNPERKRPHSIKDMQRETGLTEYWINKIIAHIKTEEG